MTRKTGVKVRALYISELIEKYINNGWHNVAEFARFLSKVDEKQGNEPAWRMNINRYMKTNNIESLPKPAEFADEDKTLVIELKKLIQNYLDYIGSLNVGYAGQFELNYDDSGFQLQKTTPGGFYDWHHDDMGHRKYTYIFYLNDIDHEGETEFANGLKIKPEQGKGLIFPATWTYAHRGIAPKDEIKYIATGWISQLVHDHNKLEHDLELH